MIKFDEFLNINPRVQYFSEFNCSGEHKGYCFDGIQAITYDGADFGDKHTKVFAHIGFPKDLSKPVPAVVLAILIGKTLIASMLIASACMFIVSAIIFFCCRNVLTYAELNYK